jgi:hypothetical protein
MTALMTGRKYVPRVSEYEFLVLSISYTNTQCNKEDDYCLTSRQQCFSHHPDKNKIKTINHVGKNCTGMGVLADESTSL